MVKKYELKQNLRLGSERYTIQNQAGAVDFTVSGSFLKIPKTFVIRDRDELEVSRIKRELPHFLPQFTITMSDGSQCYLKKKWSFLRDRYEFTDLPLVVEGDIWDANFCLKTADGDTVAEITKTRFRFTSTYQLMIFDDSYTNLIISLAVAIDYVEMLENRS